MTSFGDTQVGSYRLLAQLGSGGMADVFLAVDDRMAMAKLAVIKRIRSHLADDAELSALLLDEANVSARLNHPNVVQILDVGSDQNARWYIAMEYLDGQPLSQIIRRAGTALPKDVEMLVASDVLRGLEYAHQLTNYDGTPLGIVHRDVSPHNVFVTYEGQVKLLDFGIAKAAVRATETREGLFRGKLRYMPPEQVSGEGVDRRADIFAMGILIWQAFTGRRFWGDLPDQTVIAKLIHGEYDPSPKTICPDVPDAVDAICRRALAFQVDTRYPTAAAMLADVEDYLGNRVVDLRKSLVTIVRERFDDERRKRRAIIEDLSSSAAIATSLGALVLKGTGTHTESAKLAFDASPASVSSGAVQTQTHSLANMLEPSVTRLDPSAPRKPRRRWPLVAGAFGGTVAVALALGAARASGAFAGHAPSLVPPATVDSDRLPVAYTSDAIDGLRHPASTASSIEAPRMIAPPRPRSVIANRSASAPPAPVRGKAASAPPARSGAGPAADSNLRLDGSDPWK
jgi:eukaryotic-like serine/threonine-protein kinase